MRLRMHRLAITVTLVAMACAGGIAHARPSQARASSTRRAAHAAPASRAARVTSAPHGATATSAGMPRTLSDVHIEGEIPVPQVLFITARDPHRFMDSQHHRYLKSSLQLGDDTPFPTWVAVVNGTPDISRKEHSR